jgi:hypothetical protein
MAPFKKIHLDIGIEANDYREWRVIDALPFEPKEGERVFSATLPFSVSNEPACIFYATDEDLRQVHRASVFPPFNGELVIE